ncbi:peritrophin-44-like [Eurosta solidaginis]|uniref:peritrophin-44-like n=1 Tax=Eurosta solidaginis TaxID=178769 RepID=UPI003530AB58
MIQKSLLALVVIYSSISYIGECTVTLPNPSKLCNLFKDGMRIRKPGSCTEYIECFNSTSTAYSCPPNQQFDRKKQSCVSSGDLTDSDDYCRNRCKGIDGKWISDPASCQGYLYCNAGQDLQGYCDDGYVFNEAKSICDFEDSLQCNIVPEICDLVANNMQYRDETDCNKYYKCSKGKSVSMKCTKNAHYNVQMGSCGQQWLDNSCIPEFSCGTDKKIWKGFHSDGATCRGYFYCRDFGTVRDLSPTFAQCPVGTFFSQAAQACVNPLQSDCKYNRCQGRGNMFVQTNEDDCRNYIVCENDVEVKRQRCSGDKFFDEKSQACVKFMIAYSCCDGR